ncbi:MAG: transglutaminase-like domain-containing protein, partial [Candidatus Brocadiia bacterium]
HVAGTLVVVDHDVVVAWRSHDDLFAATVEADRYRADSVVPVVDGAGLRGAATDYPAWAEDRYLRLPDTVPPRVLGLARDLTATAPTPYDRATAIENYLRGFPYTLDVSAPPGGRDVVDFFLFDIRKGYCDYYASAMVVLARAAGLPARLAVGYAPGTYDRGEGHYVVTEADAHAWPEVYFPGYGWVRFEPTAGLPAGERPEQVARAEWAAPAEPLEPARRASGGIRWWQGLILGIMAVGVAAAIWSSVARRRFRRQDPLTALTAIYGRVRQQARRLAVAVRPGDTPNEFGVALGCWLEDFSGIGPLRGFVAEGAPELDRLVQLYARSLYSARSVDAGDRALALRIWGRLRWRLLVGQWWATRNCSEG